MRCTRSVVMHGRPFLGCGINLVDIESDIVDMKMSYHIDQTELTLLAGKESAEGHCKMEFASSKSAWL